MIYINTPTKKKTPQILGDIKKTNVVSIVANRVVRCVPRALTVRRRKDGFRRAVCPRSTRPIGLFPEKQTNNKYKNTRGLSYGSKNGTGTTCGHPTLLNRPLYERKKRQAFMKHPSPVEAQQAQRRGDERQQEHGGKRVVFWTRLISAADAQHKMGGRGFEAFLSTLGGPEKAAVSYSVSI